MSEKHTENHDYFDVEVTVDDEGAVCVEFYSAGPVGPRELWITMPFDEFREVIDFVCKHGMGMKAPYVVEYDETLEGAGV